MVEYEPTYHAVVRAKQRVGIKGKGAELKSNVRNWCNQVIPKSQYSGKDDDGRLHYRYKEFNIIVSPDNQVITVSYFKGPEKALGKEIDAEICKRIKKALRPLKSEHRKKSIQMHEAEIKRLKSYNPKSLETIQKEIDDFKDEIARLETDMVAIEGLAGRYGLKL